MVEKEFVRVSISDLIPYDNNPRKNDNAVPDVAESIKQCGDLDPIEIDENNVILAGHTRLMALMEQGFTETDVIRYTGLTEEQKKKYRILSNKTGEKALWDFDALAEELEGLDFDDYDFGFDLDDYSFENGGDIEPRELSDDFIIPPFDIFDARSKRWLERKKIWAEKIDDNAQAREQAKAYNNGATNDKSKYKGNGVMPNETSILDPVLSEIVIRWFTPYDNSKCFDCFAGDTVFGYVAGSLGHNFTGIELRQEQADFNAEHTKDFTCKYICDDGRNVAKHIKAKSQDLLFSCPPYFDLEVYSNLENDASNQKTYEDFYKILDEAFSNSITCLKNNRFAVIVCGDIRDKNGAYYNFPNDIIDTFKENGMILYNNIKLLTPIGNAQIRARRYMRNRKTAHVYQDVLVFFKGDIQAIKNEFPEIEVQIDDSEDEQVELLD